MATRRKKRGRGKVQGWDIIGFTDMVTPDHPLAWMKHLSHEDLVCIALRGVQYQSQCANRTLNMAIEVLKPHLRLRHFEHGFKNVDAIMKQESGATCLCLNGCVGCNNHVFTPQEKVKTCPRCGHDRYNEKAQPHEVCWYFPLRDKLQRLLSLPRFRQHLKHEMKRPQNSKYITDVFDAPLWKLVAGRLDARGRLTRILLQYCVDGIPAFSYGGLSVKPCEFLILNLPPALRSKVSNMLLHMLIPNHLKGQAAKKYYDWAANFEINDLHVHGVSGVRVIVYGTTLDAPGRAEMLDMQTHTSYYNCPHCHQLNAPGLNTKPVYGGYRKFLPVRHPWRQRIIVEHGYRYMFPDVENGASPTARTTQTAFESVQMATPTRPCRGHKGAPLLSSWRCFSWDLITCDIMHDVKNVCVMVLRILVGHGEHGMYHSWDARKDQSHREYCRYHNIFPEVHDDSNPLPWRLSRAAVDIIDARVQNMWFPHYMDVPHRDGFSFWKKSHLMWKSRHKTVIFMVRLHDSNIAKI